MRHAMRSDENGVAHRTSHDVLLFDGEAAKRAVVAVGHQGAGGRQPYNDGIRPLLPPSFWRRALREHKGLARLLRNNEFTPRKLKKS
jgi:hypothetical protein